jgi:septum formation protein
MIYLASASPRRQELLRQLGVAFEVVPSNVEEQRNAGENPDEYVVRVARDKARTVLTRVAAAGRPPHPVLGADTEVVLDNDILGKPENAAHGRAMLRRLAGRSHDVLTGLVLLDDTREVTAVSCSRVTFAPLSDAEIERYWRTGEPADKAGGYGIQGVAAAFVTRIEGSYSGVVGLPLFELNELLKQVARGVL